MALDPELVKNDKIQIIKLPPERWKDYRSLRLRALKDDPQAFGRSYSEEVAYSEEKWREKTNDNVLFASDSNNLIGMMGTYQSDVDKDNKTAVKLYETFGFKTMKEKNALLCDGNYYDEYLMEKDL